MQYNEHRCKEQYSKCSVEQGDGERPRQFTAQTGGGDHVEQRTPHQHGLPQYHSKGPALQHIDEVVPIDEISLRVVVLRHRVQRPHGQTQRGKVARAVISGQGFELIKHRHARSENGGTLIMVEHSVRVDYSPRLGTESLVKGPSCRVFFFLDCSISFFDQLDFPLCDNLLSAVSVLFDLFSRQMFFDLFRILRYYLDRKIKCAHW